MGNIICWSRVLMHRGVGAVGHGLLFVMSSCVQES